MSTLQASSTRATSWLRTPDGKKLVINLAILALLSIVIASQSQYFFTVSNWKNIGISIAVVVIIGMPFTLLMISGAFDLSVGANMALSGTAAALVAQHTGSSVTGLFFGAGVGLLVGGLNAFLVVGMRINSFIATIGTSYAVRGIALIISSGADVSTVPASFSHFGNIHWFNISIFIWVSIGLLLIFALVQRWTTLGLFAVAAGSNESASFLAGVPVRKTRVTLFLLTGLAAGFAGVMQASQFGLGSPTSSVGMEFQVIVAAVVGGVSLFGGRGRVGGTFLGAVIIGVVFNGLNLLRVSSYWQTVCLGIILISFVAIDELINRPGLIRRLRHRGRIRKVDHLSSSPTSSQRDPTRTASQRQI